MRTKIIDWLKANGIVYQKDFIEILYYIKEDYCKLIYDIDTMELSIIDYDSKGNILDVEILETEKQLKEAIQIFEI
jgi:hypothetical protein